MIWIQEEFTLSPKNRGFHLVTKEIISKIDLSEINIGLCQVFIQHTSASLALNENADPSVRKDMELYFNETCKDGTSYFTHTLEGSDDMPAHIKNVLLGASLSIPIKNGHLNLGTWQGIYLCEHRDYGGSRRIVLTAFGSSKNKPL